MLDGSLWRGCSDLKTMLSHTNHSHSSENVSAASALYSSPFLLRVKWSYMRIFLDNEKIRSQYIIFESIFGNAEKHIHHPDNNPHTFKEIETQHVLIYCRSRLSISNGRITVQNESSWHQTCIFFPMSCQKRTFTHFKSVLLQFFSRPLLLHDVRHSTTLELPRKTTFKRKAAPNLHFRHNKTSEKSEFVYIKCWYKYEAVVQIILLLDLISLTFLCRWCFISFLSSEHQRLVIYWTQMANIRSCVAFSTRATENAGNDRTAPPCGYERELKGSVTLETSALFVSKSSQHQYKSINIILSVKVLLFYNKSANIY